MTIRRKSFWAAAGCLVGILMLLFLLALTEEPESNPGFRLVATNQLQQGGTNIVIFRLTSLDGAEVLQPGPGFIYDPLAPQAPMYLRYGLIGPGAQAICPTNFVNTTFRSQTEFAVLAPTNNIWKLHVVLERQESFREILAERCRETWDCLLQRRFAPIKQIWGCPWRVSENYHVLSQPLTNAVPGNSAL